jgi:hypothetical protein
MLPRSSVSTHMQALHEATDGALLDRLQRGAFAFFTENTNPRNGLVADTSRAGSPCSIALRVRRAHIEDAGVFLAQ